jgi:hypothetical protein
LKRVDCVRFDIQSYPDKIVLNSFIIERVWIVNSIEIHSKN